MNLHRSDSPTRSAPVTTPTNGRRRIVRRMGESSGPDGTSDVDGAPSEDIAGEATETLWKRSHLSTLGTVPGNDA